MKAKFDLHCEHFNFINCSALLQNPAREFNNTVQSFDYMQTAAKHLEYFFGKLLFLRLFYCPYSFHQSRTM